MDAGTVVAVLMAVGAIEFVRQIVTGLFSRKRNSRKAQLDDAQVIQGMSLSLLEPLHKEIDGSAGAGASAVRRLGPCASPLRGG
jgi:hypothetical protein